jgi:hypothetical protein
MDCKTALLLIEMGRPHGTELVGAEADSLERHLAGCSECFSLARYERAWNDRLGRAMRSVEAPPALKEKILDRLHKDWVEWCRSQVGRGLRWAAAAAAVLALVLGSWHWLGGRPSVVQPEHAWNQANAYVPGKAEIEQEFRRLDAPMVAPDLNYALLVARSLGEIPGYRGRLVPLLVFQQHAQLALVYVLDTRRFALPPDASGYESPTGLRFQLLILGQDGNPYQSGERFGFMVFHNSDDLTWLKPKRVAE